MKDQYVTPHNKVKIKKLEIGYGISNSENEGMDLLSTLSRTNQAKQTSEQSPLSAKIDLNNKCK